MSQTRYVALLRGINVGRAKRIAMADLRALFTELGYGEVQTLLNSGNVIFTVPDSTTTSAEHTARIETAIVTVLGVSSLVTVLSAVDVAVIVAENSLADQADNPSRLLIAVLANPNDRTKVLPLVAQDWGSDAFAVGTRAAYLWCGGGILESQLPDALARALGNAVTTRNGATIARINSLINSDGAGS